MPSPPFTRPPLDASLTVPELYDWHQSHNPQHPLFVFEHAPAGALRTITMAEGVQGMHRATRYLRAHVHNSLSLCPRPVVLAILAASDSLTYFCTLVGAWRAGWTVFPISPRNSPPAVAHLLSETKAAHLVVSAEPSLQELAASALDLLDGTNAVQTLSMPVFADLFPTDGFDPLFEGEPSAKLDMDAVAAIYHSSGTTSFPKPISWSHRSMFWKCTLPICGDTDITGCVYGCHSVPMFHGMGLVPLCFAASVGVTVALFKPHVPAVVPNPVNVFEGALATKTEFVFVPPTFLEAWARVPEYVEALARMKGVIYGGGPLGKAAGDLLASKGVNVYLTYACTQTSIVSQVLPKPPGKDWEYFKFSPDREAHLVRSGNDEYEVVIMATDTFRPNAINTQVHGRDAFATSDLVAPHPHPSKRGYYKVVGRTDDQIMHSTGEKTNPGPLENMLMQDPLVEAGVIFGRGRFQCGVLVQPSRTHAFDPSDTDKLIEFRNAIWPTVEKLNAFASTHSRIFKEMVLVASPAKPFVYTAKGTLRRQHMMGAYEREIERLYEAVAESTQEDVDGPPGDDWTALPAVRRFVRAVLTRTMKADVRAIADDADFFEHGLDSLQATWVRNTILRVLREAHTRVARALSVSVVYDHPTIARLAGHLAALVAGAGGGVVHDDEAREAKKAALRALVDKYTSAFPAFTAGCGVVGAEEGEGAGAVVLLTGGTGSLGSNILARLLCTPGVARVYAMSRPSPEGAATERLARAFAREGLDGGILASDRLRVVEGDAGVPDFGVAEEVYAELQSSVTHVIHNAWRVNFNNAVTSFEGNIRSVRNLVDFALGGHGASPARILFVSSIGVFQNYAGEAPAREEPLEAPDSALGSGYGESKWVAEQILLKAVEETRCLRATIVRPGQMTGGPNGAWSTREWFPSLVKSSVALGMLPDVEGMVSWLPADVAAAAIADTLHASAADARVLHLVHPRPVAWSSIIAAFSDELAVRIAPYDAWLAALEASNADLEFTDAAQAEDALARNPALRLLSFFRAAAARARAGGGNVEPLCVARLSAERMVGASSAVRDARAVGKREVGAWVAYWRRSGFLE